MALFAIKNGLKLFNSDQVESDVLNGTVDPSQGAGISAPQGSLYLKQDGISYKKTGAGDTDWQPYSEIEGGGLLWSTISGATTAVSSKGYILDSSSAGFTVTMPASPEEGDSVGFAGLGDIETNNITVSLNGNNLNGSSDDLVIDLNYCYFEMLYTGDATTGWVLSNTDESGNVDNIQNFIGNNDNVDAGTTEFTEENYIVGGDSLEDAIDKLDIALADAEATTSGVDADLSALDARVTTNEGDISTNISNIATNSGNIATNASDIDTLESDMSTAQSDIITNTNNIATNSGNIASNDTDISNLETFVGSAGSSSPDYTTEYYITDGDDLEAAISKLDAALNTVDNLAQTGVNWQQTAKAITADVVNTTVGAYSGTDHFSDDDVPFWTHDDWSDGDRVVSMNAATSGVIYTWDDGADQWNQSGSLGANDAIAVQYDFPDAPGSQEDGAAYMMKSDLSGLIKIADFDLETAASIAISSGYTATSGTISASDSVESAIEKLDWEIQNAVAGDISALESRVTTNEGDIDTLESDMSTAQADIITNTNNITTNSGNIATNASDIDSLEGRMDTAETDILTNAGDITTNSGNIADNYTYITNVDTAHDNLAAAVLTETSTVVADSATDTVLDTVTQAGNLGAKWFVIAYDGAGKRYACEIYAMHNGATSADLTEYAILSIGTPILDVDFDIAADGTNMSLTVDNASGGSVTVKTQRVTVQTTEVDTTAVLS
jgi:hypothetical protein